MPGSFNETSCIALVSAVTAAAAAGVASAEAAGVVVAGASVVAVSSGAQPREIVIIANATRATSKRISNLLEFKLQKVIF
jgi:DNA-binding IclR family transcriptional regulator